MSEHSELEELKKRLYKTGEVFKERERGNLSVNTEKAPIYWQSSTSNKKTNFGMMKKIILFLAIVFATLLGVIAYFVFSEATLVSSDNVVLDIRAPIRVDGGQPLGFNIFIENKNNSPLKSVDLIVDFPDNVFLGDGTRLTRKRFSLGEIEPLSVTNQSIELVVMGLEDEEKEIKVSLEYRLADSNAIFGKTTNYSLKITKAPLGVSLSLPKETSSKQEFDLNIGVVSNTNLITRDVFLQVKYPAGFQFISSEPKPAKGDNVWSLGDLVSLQKKEVLIRGFVEGQDLDEKAFTSLVGVFSDGENVMPYGSAEGSFVMKKPALDISIFIKGKNIEENIAKEGESVRVEIQWLNNLPYPIHDAEIVLGISGTGYNERTISPGKGFYRSYDKKIIWNVSTLPSLGVVRPGEGGNVSFGFSINKPLIINTSSDKDFFVNLDVGVNGFTTTESSQNTEISGSSSKNIKIASGLQLVAQVLHYMGDLENTGPMPPQVGKETTYTITWSLSKTSNDFSGVKVSAVLPTYVQWLDTVFPTGENVVFNEKDGTILWSIDKIFSGTGIISPARTVSFKVSLNPSLSQRDTEPVLVDKISLEAHDDFIGENFNENYTSLDTRLSSDVQFKQGQSKVVE